MAIMPNSFAAMNSSESVVSTNKWKCSGVYLFELAQCQVERTRMGLFVTSSY